MVNLQQLQEILGDEQREVAARRFIESLRDGPQPLDFGTPFGLDVRTLMFYVYEGVSWNNEGTRCFVWGYDGHPTFKANWERFLRLVS